jgi:hypothetical protein
MSYEYCETHDQDATNGCPDCEQELHLKRSWQTCGCLLCANARHILRLTGAQCTCPPGLVAQHGHADRCPFSPVPKTAGAAKWTHGPPFPLCTLGLLCPAPTHSKACSRYVAPPESSPVCTCHESDYGRGHLSSCPLYPGDPEPSPQPKSYDVPICPVLWRVTVSDQYEERTTGTYVLAPSAAMALAAAGRFYDWPRLPKVDTAKTKVPTDPPDGYAVLQAEISVQCFPQKMFILIRVYPVRALDEYANHFTGTGWDAIRLITRPEAKNP